MASSNKTDLGEQKVLAYWQQMYGPNLQVGSGGYNSGTGSLPLQQGTPGVAIPVGVGFLIAGVVYTVTSGATISSTGTATVTVTTGLAAAAQGAAVTNDLWEALLVGGSAPSEVTLEAGGSGMAALEPASGYASYVRQPASFGAFSGSGSDSSTPTQIASNVAETFGTPTVAQTVQGVAYALTKAGTDFLYYDASSSRFPVTIAIGVNPTEAVGTQTISEG